MKKRESLKFNGAWYNDVELHERSQVQEMLNRLAEESIRRMEMVCITKFIFPIDTSRTARSRLSADSWWGAKLHLSQVSKSLENKSEHSYCFSMTHLLSFSWPLIVLALSESLLSISRRWLFSPAHSITSLPVTFATIRDHRALFWVISNGN